MPIGPGTTLARYRVESKLGEGGMGVVWKATDTTLGRAVALKLLPEAFARDPERVARFEREARLLASLNHPHIAAIYGLESDGGARFLAMEYAEGDTLASRLAGGPLPHAEARAIALQIADALESAHDRGIVHRDLKPQNVQIAHDGNVKLLDFGLARAFAPDGPRPGAPDDSPTISAVMTGAEVILGTAAYMSPEQARGKLVDRRADIWAFGVVLFEMLTGKRLFEGEGTSDILASVLRQDVPWDRLPRDVPADLRDLLARCLERDPRLRLRDIGEARIMLASPHAAVTPAPSSRRTIPLWAALVPLLLLAGALAWILRPRPAPETAGPPRRFELAPVQDLQRAAPVLAPDGSAVAYIDQDQLWVRGMGQLEGRSLVADPEARSPFWSPDAKTIGYTSGPRVMRIPAYGGASEMIGEFAAGVAFGGDACTWDEQGRVIVTRGLPDGLLAFPERGGEARTLFAADTTRESDFHDPSALPGDRGILVVPHRKSGADNISLVRNGKLTTLLDLPRQELRRPRYSATGHIVFERVTSPAGVWAVPFSLAQLKVTGEPILVAARAVSPSLSRDGTLAYILPPVRPLEFAWLDRTGKLLERLAKVGTISDGTGVFDLSPDGKRVAVSVGNSTDLWVYDLERGTSTQLTRGEGMEINPAWTSDGTRIAYQASPGRFPGFSAWAIILVAADGSGKADTLVTGGAIMAALTPDSGTLLYTHTSDRDGWPLQALPLRGGGAAVSLTDGSHIIFGTQVSPDGRLVAYSMDATQPTAMPEIIVQSLAGGAAGTRASVGRGLWPRWNAKGDRLYFVQGDKVFETTVGPGDPAVIGRPTLLFTRPAVGLPMIFDWSPKFDVQGDRFLVLHTIDDEHTAPIVLVENWLEEIRK
jgi:serine/threonine-protein kinase